MCRSDSDIQRDLRAEIDREIALDDEDLVCQVRDGVVVLKGCVESWAERCRAEEAVRGVRGVRGLINDLEVHLPPGSVRSDFQIARAAIEALRSDPCTPLDRLTVKVRDAWLTLEGDVDHPFERAAAERAVRDLTGLKGVLNLVGVEPQRPVAGAVDQKVRDALERVSLVDAGMVKIELAGGTLTLRGRVRSSAAREVAGRVARNTPGVVGVDNLLTIDPSFPVRA